MARQLPFAATLLVAVFSTASGATDRNDTSALDAVRAAADAAKSAAQAAQAAARAATVAAEAAHVSVTGQRPPARSNQRASTSIAAPQPLPAPSSSAPVLAAPASPTASAVSDHAPRETSRDGTLVFDQSDIAASNATTVAEFLRKQVPTLTAVGLAGQDDLASGFGFAELRGLPGDQLLVLIDGQRTAASMRPDGQLAQRVTALPLSALERIEVLPDGMAARYGEGTTAGVINLVTRRDVRGLQASAGLVQRDDDPDARRQTYGVVAGASGKLGSVMLALEGAETPNTAWANGPDEVSTTAHDSAFARVALRPLEGIEVFADGSAVRTDVMDNAGTLLTAREDAYNVSAGASLSTDVLGGWSLAALARRSESRLSAGGNDLTSSLDVANVQLDSGGLGIPGLRLPFYVGAEQRRSTVSLFPELEDDVQSLYGGVSVRLLGVLDAGYQRRDETRDTFDNALTSERYHATLRLLPGVSVFGAYATGSNTGSLTELNAALSMQTFEGIDFARCEKTSPGVIGVDAQGLPIVLDSSGLPATSPCLVQPYIGNVGGQPQLSPERSTHWRAGFAFNASPLALSISAYQATIDDLIGAPSAAALLAEEWQNGASALVVRRSDSGITELNGRVRNAGQIDTRGAELDLRVGSFVDPDDALGLRVIAHYIDRYALSPFGDVPADTPNDLLLPRLRANVQLNYRPMSFASLLLSGRFVDEAASADRSQIIEEWFSVDAQLSLDLPWRGALTFGVLNALDVRAPATFGITEPVLNPSRYGATGRASFLRYRQSL